MDCVSLLKASCPKRRSGRNVPPKSSQECRRRQPIRRATSSAVRANGIDSPAADEKIVQSLRIGLQLAPKADSATNLRAPEDRRPVKSSGQAIVVSSAADLIRGATFLRVLAADPAILRLKADPARTSPHGCARLATTSLAAEDRRFARNPVQAIVATSAAGPIPDAASLRVLAAVPVIHPGKADLARTGRHGCARLVKIVRAVSGRSQVEIAGIADSERTARREHALMSSPPIVKVGIDTRISRVSPRIVPESARIEVRGGAPGPDSKNQAEMPRREGHKGLLVRALAAGIPEVDSAVVFNQKGGLRAILHQAHADKDAGPAIADDPVQDDRVLSLTHSLISPRSGGTPRSATKLHRIKRMISARGEIRARVTISSQ